MDYLVPITLIVVALIQSATGILVYQKNRNSRINISFLLFMASLSLWTALMGLAYFSSYFSYDLTLFLTRVSTVPAFFFPSIFLYFTLIFPENTYKETKAFFVFHGSSILFFLLFLFTNFYIKSTPIDVGKINFKFGIVYNSFGIYILITMICGCYILFKKFFTLKGIRKYQALLLMIGIFVSLLLGVTFAFILPALNIYLNFLAPTCTLFLIGFTAYAIVKTRFMDIRIAINRIMAYLILIITYAFFMVILTSLYSRFFVFGINPLSFFFITVFLLFASLLFHPLRLKLQTTPDRFLFRKKYLYDQTIKELTKKSSRLVGLNELVELFNDKIKLCLKTKKTNFFLISDYRNVFEENKNRQDV
ncbi:MAG: hypothetical protein HQ564_02835 [Candidatus Saganbacteria bacterium]|nr:hypothetical protein [Candidatus Saganbacteria bacterium]